MRLSRHPLARLALLLLPAVFAATLGLPVARATETRVRSLGGDGDCFEDVANVLRWYGSLPSYGNTAVLELGEFDGRHGADASDQQAVRQGAGAHVSLGPEGRSGVVAAYLAREGDTGAWPAAQILMYGRAWSRWQLGCLLGVNRSDVEEISIAGEKRVEDSEDEVFGLGVRCDLGESAYLDVAGDWRGARREYRGSSWSLADRSWGSFGLRTRLFWGLSERVVLVPFAAYARDDRWELRADDLPERLDGWGTRTGAGLNILPSGDVTGIAAIEWRRRGWNVASLDPAAGRFGGRWDEVVTRLGLEARLRPWLSLRAGVVNAPGQPSLFEAETDDFDLTLGLGLHLGSLDADFLLNDDAAFNLGSAVTNAGEGEDSTFTSVSISYCF